MAELIQAIRSSRNVGSGDSEEDIAHTHTTFYTPDGELLTEACPLDEACDSIREGNPLAETNMEVA